MNTAYFVRSPRTIDDLRRPHLVSAERPYEIVAEVKLAAIDYENFTTDMLADRRFIEDNAGRCGEGEIVKCILVRRRDEDGGVLIVPGRKAHVAFAALLPLPSPMGKIK